MESLFTELDKLCGPKFWTRNNSSHERMILNSSDETYSGILYLKREENIQTLRYFILDKGTLFFLKVISNESKKDLRIVKQTEVTWKQFEPFVETSFKKLQYGFRLIGHKDFQDFYTENEEDLISWIENLSKFSINTNFEENYSIIREIGRGSHAEVFECKDRFTNIRYAVKQVTKSLLSVNENKQKLLQEIGTLRKIKHELLANLLKVFESESHIYLVLELGFGGDLQKRILKNGKYSEFETEKIIKQLLKVVNFLHQEGISHGQIRAEHILLVSRENEHRIKLIGLSSTSSSLSVDERTGESKVFFDIFSIGVVMFILLSGEYSFSLSSMNEIMRKIEMDELSETYSWWTKISNEAKDLMNWLTNPDPFERPNAKEAEIHPWICEMINSMGFNETDGENFYHTDNHLKDSILFIKNEMSFSNFSKFCQRIGLDEEIIEEEEGSDEDTLAPCGPSEKIPGLVFQCKAEINEEWQVLIYSFFI